MAPNSSFAYWGGLNPIDPASVISDSNTTAQNLGSGMRSYSNYLTFPYNVSFLNQYTTATGRALNVRCENVLGPLTNGYPNAPWSLPPAGIQVKNQKWNFSNMLSVGYTPGSKYSSSYM